MIVGYTMKDNVIYCASCWRTRRPESPDRVLHTRVSKNPMRTSGSETSAKAAAGEIKYREARHLA